MTQTPQTTPPLRVWDGEADRGVCRLQWHADTITELVPEQSGTDTSDLSVIPGLIDTHVHLVGSAAPGADFFNWPVVTRPEEQVLHALANARSALEGGTTTVRDLAATHIQFSLKRALDAGVLAGPRVLAHGIVSMTAGHGDMFTPPAVRERTPTADGPWECRRLVREWARAGADGVKIATSGGVLSGDENGWRNHTDEEIAAIVDEAHALGMAVAAHAHTPAGIERALRHGVDSIEHGTQLTDQLTAQILEQGVTLAPTLLINDRIASGSVPVSASQQAKAREIVHARDAALRAAAERGLDIVLGTDANGYHVGFGEQMAEVRRMAEVLGWSAERALQSATSRAARALGHAGRIGALAPGAAADFVIMHGQPWTDSADLRVENIIAVVAGGRVVAGTLPV